MHPALTQLQGRSGTAAGSAGIQHGTPLKEDAQEDSEWCHLRASPKTVSKSLQLTERRAAHLLPDHRRVALRVAHGREGALRRVRHPLRCKERVLVVCKQ